LKDLSDEEIRNLYAIYLERAAPAPKGEPGLIGQGVDKVLDAVKGTRYVRALKTLTDDEDEEEVATPKTPELSEPAEPSTPGDLKPLTALPSVPPLKPPTPPNFFDTARGRQAVKESAFIRLGLAIAKDPELRKRAYDMTDISVPLPTAGRTALGRPNNALPTPGNPQMGNSSLTVGRDTKSSLDAGESGDLGGAGGRNVTAQVQDLLTAHMFKTAYNSHVNPSTSWSGAFVDQRPWMMDLEPAPEPAKPVRKLAAAPPKPARKSAPPKTFRKLSSSDDFNNQRMQEARNRLEAEQAEARRRGVRWTPSYVPLEKFGPEPEPLPTRPTPRPAPGYAPRPEPRPVKDSAFNDRKSDFPEGFYDHDPTAGPSNIRYVPDDDDEDDPVGTDKTGSPMWDDTIKDGSDEVFGGFEDTAPWNTKEAAVPNPVKALKAMAARYKAAPGLADDLADVQRYAKHTDAELAEAVSGAVERGRRANAPLETSGLHWTEQLGAQAPLAEARDLIGRLQHRQSALKGRLTELEPLAQRAQATREAVNEVGALGGLGLGGGGLYAATKESSALLVPRVYGLARAPRTVSGAIKSTGVSMPREKTAIFGMSTLPKLLPNIRMPGAIADLMNDFASYATRKGGLEQAQTALDEARALGHSTRARYEQANDSVMAARSAIKSDMQTARDLRKDFSASYDFDDVAQDRFNAQLGNLESGVLAAETDIRKNLRPHADSLRTEMTRIEKRDIPLAEQAFEAAKADLDRSTAVRGTAANAANLMGGVMAVGGVGLGLNHLHNKHGGARNPFDRAVSEKLGYQISWDSNSRREPRGMDSPVDIAGVGAGAGAGWAAAHMGAQDRALQQLEGVKELMAESANAPRSSVGRNAMQMADLRIKDVMGPKYKNLRIDSPRMVNPGFDRLLRNLTRRIQRKRLLPLMAVGGAMGLGAGNLYQRGLERKRMVPDFDAPYDEGR
jgi:hypothetical protein